MRIVLSGGGTGGHIMPILTLASALKASQPDLDLIYIGEHNQLTTELLKSASLKVYYINAGKWRRYRQSWWLTIVDIKSLALNIRDLFKFIIAFSQSLWLLIKLRPQLVFAKGGYVGLPVGLAAWVLGIPLVIHESDAVPGLTNRILSHLSDRIAVSWPINNFPNWQQRPLVFTGNPIRRELLKADQGQAAIFFKLDPKRQTILVMGGSTGARAINQSISKLLPDLLSKYQLIHVVGERDKRHQSARHPRYRRYTFLDTEQLALAYALADIVICRAGMNTISEIAALNKPAIVIPSPFLAGGHQLKNAELLETYQAAVVLDQADLEKRLLLTIDELIQSSDAQALLRKGLLKIAHPEAATELSQVILDLL